MASTIQLPTLSELHKGRRRWVEDADMLSQKADDTREALRCEKKDSFSRELVDACVNAALQYITPKRISKLVDEFIQWGSRVNQDSFVVTLHDYRVMDGKVTATFTVKHNNRKREEHLPLELSGDDWIRYNDDVMKEVTSRLPRDIANLVEVLIQLRPPKYPCDTVVSVGMDLTLKIRPEPESS